MKKPHIKESIKALSLESKHKLMSLLFANAKGLRESTKSALKYLHEKRLSIIKEESEHHGYLGADILAIEAILKIVYDEN